MVIYECGECKQKKAFKIFAGEPLLNLPCECGGTLRLTTPEEHKKERN